VIYKPTVNQIKYILIAVAVVVLFALSGRYGYKYIKKEEKALKTHISDLENEKSELLETIKLLDIQEKNYYDEYVYEYNRRIRAEKALSNIDTLTFGRKYLDSISKHIKY